IPRNGQPAGGAGARGPVLSPIGGTRAKWRHTRQRRDTSDRGRGRLPTITARVNRRAEPALRRELYFYSLYRLLEASMLVLVVFGPVAELLGPARHPMAAATVALTFAILSVLLFALHRRGELHVHALLGVA